MKTDAESKPFGFFSILHKVKNLWQTLDHEEGRDNWLAHKDEQKQSHQRHGTLHCQQTQSTAALLSTVESSIYTLSHTFYSLYEQKSVV